TAEADVVVPVEAVPGALEKTEFEVETGVGVGIEVDGRNDANWKVQ
ncbi:hypothetical protein FDECE_15670, partial [Fusarium decemcellulare]